MANSDYRNLIQLTSAFVEHQELPMAALSYLHQLQFSGI